MKLSLIVPCYNEENNVQKFYEEAQKTFSGQGFEYEYVFVNDGSSDRTMKNLRSLFEAHPESNIQVINFSRNFGKEAAIYAGLKNARGDAICLIDADLQQRPEVALEMLNILENNDELDCVTAYQDKRKEGKAVSMLKSAFYKIINKITDIPFINGASDFRLFRSYVRDAILDLPEYHRFSKGIFSWVGFNTYYMPYEVQERKSGESKWSVRKLFKYALEGIISFTTTPLRLATYLGIITSAISLIYMIVVIIQKLAFSINIPGYATIVVLILLLGGIQLFCIGVIGEYLAKIFVQGKNRPICIVKEKLIREDNKNASEKE